MMDLNTRNLDNVVYLDDKKLNDIIKVIEKYYTHTEEVPTYRNDREGIEKLMGIYGFIQSNLYYPTLTDKVTALLVLIAKGHYFENGNKRMAYVSTLIFLLLNGKQIVEREQSFFENILKETFPKCDTFLINDPLFKPEEYFLGNLTLIIACSEKIYTKLNHFDQLKLDVRKVFLETVAERKEERGWLSLLFK